MQTQPVQLTDVIYNATNQCFEALVTVHDGPHSRKYPCAIDAPIDMSFADAASGLRTQALRRHNASAVFYSEVRRPAPPPRAGRPAFDPLRWLETIVHLPGRRAA